MKRSHFRFTLNLELEAVGHFGEAKRAVGIHRINFLDHVAALRVAEIQPECQAVFPFVIGADVVKSGKIFLAVRRASVESKCVWLKRAAAGIPEITLATEPQTVNVAAQRELV